MRYVVCHESARILLALRNAQCLVCREGRLAHAQFAEWHEQHDSDVHGAHCTNEECLVCRLCGF
jgi:hypothetical protein